MQRGRENRSCSPVLPLSEIPLLGEDSASAGLRRAAVQWPYGGQRNASVVGIGHVLGVSAEPKGLTEPCAREVRSAAGDRVWLWEIFTAPSLQFSLWKSTGEGIRAFFLFLFLFFIFAKTCCPYTLRSGDTHRSSVRIHLQGLGSWRRISQNHEIRNRPSPEAWLKSPKSAPRTSGANSFD